MGFTVFLILITLVCLLLLLVVMVQNPKGGGLSSSFGGSSQQLGGVKKTTDFLVKGTWTLFTMLLVLVFLSNVFMKSDGSNNSLIDSEQEGVIENQVIDNAQESTDSEGSATSSDQAAEPVDGGSSNVPAQNNESP